MVSGETGRLRLRESKGEGAITTDKDSKVNKRRDDAIPKKKLKAQKRKNAEPFDSPIPTSNKKARLRVGEENNQDEFTPTKTKKEGSSETLSVESKGVAECQPPEQKASIQQPTGAPSWIQKSAWRDLVGETNNSSFSISHILPGINSITKKVQETTNSGTANSSAGKEKSLTKPMRNEVTLDSSKTCKILKDGNQIDKVNVKGDKNAFSNPSSERNGSEEPNKKATRNVVSVQVSSFMRSAASEKEWLKIKTALSGSLKKKSTVK